MKSGIEPAARTLKPGDFPLGSAKSRAMARALCEEKKQEPNVVEVTHHVLGPSSPPRLHSSYTDSTGECWQVWIIEVSGDAEK